MDEPPASWWKVLLAALPLLAVGLHYLLVSRGTAVFGATPERLGAAMQVEFMVIHSTLFIGWMALWKPPTRRAAIIRAIGLWGIFFVVYIAWLRERGLEDLLIFLGATLVTYLGLFLNWRSDTARIQLAVRWLVTFLVFMLATHGAGGLVNLWSGPRALDAVNGGALYFLALGAIELTGFYLRWIPLNARRLIDSLKHS